MIPLVKPPEQTLAYEEWLKNNRVELEKGYSSEKWISQENREAIQALLFPTSYDKCAYCERWADELQIDHFLPKSQFRDKVFEWDNLIPCCKPCNTAKGTNFEHENCRMFHPYNQNTMKDHLTLDCQNLMLSGFSPEGIATVYILRKALNVNITTNGMTKKTARSIRQKIKTAINKKLTTLSNNCEEINWISSTLEDLLHKIDREKSFTSTRATVLLNHPIYKELMQHLLEKDPEKHAVVIDLENEKRQFCLHPLD